MDKRRVLHERSRSDLNEMASSAGVTRASSKSSQDRVSDGPHLITATPIRHNSRGSNKTSSTHASSEAASVATFGSLPPVPPLHINKVPPLSIHKKRDSENSNSGFASDSEASRIRPLSPALSVHRDSRLANPIQPLSRYIVPSTSTDHSGTTRTSTTSTTSRPLPLKPILKKNKSPLPPYSTEEYEAKRRSWVGSPPSRASLQTGQSIRLVNSEAGSNQSSMAGRTRSTLSATSQDLSRLSTVSPISPRASLRQSSIAEEFGYGRNEFLSSQENSRSTRTSSGYLNTSRSTSDNYYGITRIPSVTSERPGTSDTVAGPSTLPGWAKKYYGSGERGLALVESPEETRYGHTRRAASYGDSLNISELSPNNRRATYPMFSPGSSGSDLTRYPTPHLDNPPRVRTKSIKQPHLLFFCFGFILPFLWIFGAFWPLGVKPHMREIEGDVEAGIEPQIEYYYTTEDEQQYSNARWWRRINRGMAVAGVLVCGAIITLGILGWRRIPPG